MAQPGDFRVQNGVWEAYDGSKWVVANPIEQEWFSDRYSGVTGTGNAQRFENLGYPEIDASQYASKSEFVTRYRQSKARGEFDLAPTGPGTQTPRSIQSLWGEFMPDVPWPPVDKLLGEIDTNLINSFLASLRANNVAGWSDPKRFTIEDAQGRTHVFGQAPGSTLSLIHI